MKNFITNCRAILLAAGAFFLLNACTDTNDNPGPGAETGKLKIEFDNVVGDKNLVLNGVTYTNAANENFTVTRFNYFISNIKLIKADGSSYTVPQDSSYFLIREDIKTSQIVTLNNIPPADYKAVEFMVGVDSLRSTAPIEKRTGVLDPSGSMSEDGMYWAWNSGYIFMKLEGKSPVGHSVNGSFFYHIGLFGGYSEKTVNNTRVVKVEFGNLTASVKKDITPEVHLFVDVQKVFNGPGTTLKIAEFNSIMSGQQAKSQEVANNYAKMFTVDHIH